MTLSDRVPTVSQRVHGRGRVTVSSVSIPLQGGHALGTLDGTTQNPRPCPDAPASVGLPLGWLEEDDRRRARMMAAGRQRLERSRKRSR